MWSQTVRHDLAAEQHSEVKLNKGGLDSEHGSKQVFPGAKLPSETKITPGLLRSIFSHFDESLYMLKGS